MKNRFDMINTSISSLKLIQGKPLNDHRGYFERLFCERELSTLINGKRITQINRTLTMKRGTVRGIHFQNPPYTEIKLVSCIRGAVFDIAIDLRKHSPTFLQYHAEILAEDNHKTLLIPDGFAHGFQTLTENCELLYFHTNEYNKDSEGGLHPLDPQLAVKWPLPISNLSDRDKSHSLLTKSFQGII